MATTTNQTVTRTPSNKKKKVPAKGSGKAKKVSAPDKSIASAKTSVAAPSKRAFKASKASAQMFVQRLRLPAHVRASSVRARTSAAVDFDASKQQAAAVGSSVVSFVEGISAQTREDICHAALLAQLAANKKVPDAANVFAWFDAYFGALMQLGWLLQESGFREYVENKDGLEAHQAIRNVAVMLLGPAPTALALAISTIDAMQSMDKNDPWITVFNREHREAKTAHFQISLAEQDPNGRLIINMLAFTLEASAKLTQVLFLKLRKSKVTFKQNLGKATVNQIVLFSVREALKQKLAERTAEYIATVEI